MEKHYIGVDLGGTKILSAVATGSGKIIEKICLPTQARLGKEKVIENIKTSIRELMRRSKQKISAIGIGAPGPVLFDKGIIANPPNLPGWHRVPLRSLIEKEFEMDCVLENDANAAALGEQMFGAGKGFKNFIYVTVSTGIGGGLVLDGKLYRGAVGGAGEIGHMIIKTDGPKCGCGKHGCLEALASGRAMERRAKEAAGTGRSLILKLAGGRIDRIDPKVVEEAARLKDKTAIEVIKETAYYLGVGLSNLVNIFAPDMIALGGGIMNMGDMLIGPVRENVLRLSLWPAREHVLITRAMLKDNTGVLGAVALLREGK